MPEEIENHVDVDMEDFEIPHEPNITSNLNDPVQVFCRLRPLHDSSESTCVKLLSPTTLLLSSDTKVGRKECSYIFRHIFTSYAGQREIFEHVAIPLLQDQIKGRNGLLFTYGMTGSGKTFTLTGEMARPGVVPRCINTLFNSIGEFQTAKFLVKSDRMNGFEVQSETDAAGDRLKENKLNRRLKTVIKRDKIIYDNDGTKLANINESNLYAVFISYTEIYNNTVYDLLDQSAAKVLQAKIIREDSQKNMYVNGVVELEVKSADEAFELFTLGQRRKRMGHTILNSESSRSHSIFNIRVVQINPQENSLAVGQLSLVDLAGSERCNRAQTTGARLKEASSINNSLMSLRICLDNLRENQMNSANKLVPYRDSRLTLLFKNYFEGEGQVKMVVCVNPAVEDCEENLQVLKFAELTQDVRVARGELHHTPYRQIPKLQKGAPYTQTPSSSKSHRVLPFSSCGPKISSGIFELENPSHNEVAFDSLLKILATRIKKKRTNGKALSDKTNRFHKRLIKLHHDEVLVTAEISSLKAYIKQQKQANRNLNVKIADIETTNRNLHATNDELHDAIRGLENMIAEKNLKINQNHLDREKAKQKLLVQSEKMNRELDERLWRQRRQLQDEMKIKEAKIRQVREILESDTISVSSGGEAVNPPLEESPKLIQVQQKITLTNPRQRRSRSAGEVWLEHNSVKPVPLGTVLQPAMKKRKSVSKLKKAGDITNSKQNKYCLIAQEADVKGEMETRVYKADIVSTCGGGAQVIFNDVECLRQESPTASPNK